MARHAHDFPATFLPGALLLLALSGASGQMPGFAETYGSAAMDRLGHRVASGGDFDGDGREDFVVSAPRADSGSMRDRGRVYAISGANGQTLFSMEGRAAADRFGDAVACLPDLDGDGRDDLAVGAPGHDGSGINCGRVSWHSGRDGSELFAVDGPRERSGFGRALAMAGDLDGDGRSELIVGAPTESVDAPGQGVVRVLSGQDGSSLFEWRGDVANDALGWSVAGGSDLDDDGVADLAAGAPRHFRVYVPGKVKAWSGASGSLIAQPMGLIAGDAFGWSLAMRRARLAVGVPRAPAPAGHHAGNVGLYALPTGDLQAAFFGEAAGEQLGTALCWSGDLDGDGTRDLAIGSPGHASPQDGTAGLVRVQSGADRSELARIVGSSLGEGFGTSTTIGGDLDGDGLEDVVVGAPGASGALGPGQGRAIVHALCAARPYGPSTPLRLAFEAGAPAQPFGGHLVVQGGTPASSGFLYLSLAPFELRLGPGLHLLVDPSQGPLTWGAMTYQFDSGGEWRIGWDLSDPAVRGRRVFGQAYDPGPPQPLASNGLELVSCP